jgi:uncharacterized protein (DUF302 family)
MKTPEYVSVSEVQRVCSELGLRDWSSIADFDILPSEAKKILAQIGGEAGQIGLADFVEGLQVELEHGRRFPDANITNNHPILTAKIVLAHLKETLLYYRRIAIAELEADLFKATLSTDGGKSKQVYGKLIGAKAALLRAEASALSHLNVDYYFSKLLSLNFDQAVQKTTEALKAEGFGIITEIDVRTTLKNKIDVDFGNYRILGACNPALAHQALLLEDKVGTMLPCNVIVQDREAGKTEVAAINPVASMMSIDNSELQRAAEVIRDRLQKVIESL